MIKKGLLQYAMDSNAEFIAVFDDGCILEWEKGRSFRRVHRIFKHWGQVQDAYGMLFRRGTLIRVTAGYKPVYELQEDDYDLFGLKSGNDLERWLINAE